MLKNFCTPQTNNLEKVVKASPRAKLTSVHGQFILSSQSPLKSEDYLSYACSIDKDRKHLMFKNKFSMVSMLCDKEVHRKRLCLQIDPRNIMMF